MGGGGIYIRARARGRGVHSGYPPRGSCSRIFVFASVPPYTEKKKKTTPLHSCMGIVPTQKSGIVSFIILCYLSCCLLACDYGYHPAGWLRIEGVPSIYMRICCVPRAVYADERGEAVPNRCPSSSQPFRFNLVPPIIAPSQPPIWRMLERMQSLKQADETAHIMKDRERAHMTQCENSYNRGSALPEKRDASPRAASRL